MPASGHMPSDKFTTLSARRIWSVAEKRLIVSELAVPGANASAIARKHGVAQSLLYRWRKDMAAIERGVPHFVPVAIAPPGPKPVLVPSPAAGVSANASKSNARIDVVLANGRSVRVSLDVDTAALVRIILALETRE